MRLDSNIGSFPYIAIAIMAVVTLITRWGGVFVMSFMPINDRIKQFISAMSSSVLIALLTPLAFEGDGGARVALISTAIVALVIKKPLPAILSGILAAAIFRASLSIGF